MLWICVRIKLCFVAVLLTFSAAQAQITDVPLYSSSRLDVYAREIEIVQSPTGPLVSFIIDLQGKGEFLPGSFDGVMKDSQIDLCGGIVCEPFHGDGFDSVFLFDDSEAVIADHHIFEGFVDTGTSLTGVFSLFTGQQDWQLARIYNAPSVNVHLSFTIGQPGSDYTELVEAEFMPVLAGDANLDGMVDINDFLLLKSNYGQDYNCSWDDGDFNGDNTVDIFDFLMLKSSYGFSSDIR